MYVHDSIRDKEVFGQEDEICVCEFMKRKYRKGKVRRPHREILPRIKLCPDVPDGKSESVKHFQFVRSSR